MMLTKPFRFLRAIPWRGIWCVLKLFWYGIDVHDKHWRGKAPMEYVERGYSHLNWCFGNETFDYKGSGYHHSVHAAADCLIFLSLAGWARKRWQQKGK